MDQVNNMPVITNQGPRVSNSSISAKQTTMAKNRNKKRNNSDKAPMDTTEITVNDAPQDMDTSETVDKSSNLLARKIKGVQMKRTKNVRRKKAVAKAIAKVEKYSEKSTKLETKRMRVRSAKTLYD